MHLSGAGQVRPSLKRSLAVIARLKGSERREYMARVVHLLGRGGQSFAEQVLGWNRGTIRKGQREL